MSSVDSPDRHDENMEMIWDQDADNRGTQKLEAQVISDVRDDKVYDSNSSEGTNTDEIFGRQKVLAWTKRTRRSHARTTSASPKKPVNSISIYLFDLPG